MNKNNNPAQNKQNILIIVLLAIICLLIVGFVLMYRKAQEQGNNGQANRTEQTRKSDEKEEERNNSKKADKAFKEFLQLKRTVSMKLGSDTETKELYLSDFVENENQEVLKYSYIYPMAGKEKQLVILHAEVWQGEEYNTYIYIIRYEDEQLVVSNKLFMKDMHEQGVLNQYGVIRHYQGGITDGINHGNYYILSDGQLERINTYWHINLFSGMDDYTAFYDEKTTQIIKEVMNTIPDFRTEDYMNLSFEEYCFEDSYYVPFCLTDKEKEFVERCEEKGLRFVTQEEVVNMIDKAIKEAGSAIMFEDTEVEWTVWKQGTN